jgi:hypothetical protein
MFVLMTTIAIIKTMMDSYQKKAEDSMAKLEGKMVETMERQMKHLMTAKWNTHQEVTETDPNTEMMQSAEEHQDIPNEVAAVMPVRGLRKRRRVWKLAAERHQKPKEGTRGYCGSRRRVTVAG